MRLLYATKEKKSGIVITGEIGTGKTVLSRVLVRLLKKDKAGYEIAILVNPNVPIAEFLHEIIYQFGKTPPPSAISKSTLLHTLEDILDKNNKNGKHSIILVDEAQKIVDDEIFEELRLLLNYQGSGRPLLSLVLFGHPELAEKVASNKALEQRLPLKYQLKSLGREETENYIQFRLEVAGHPSPQDVFTKESLELIHRASGGVPRVINDLCDMCLLMGFSQARPKIEEDIAAAVIGDVKKTEETVRW
ncbi:MAG: AAA family ATPase [Planctomycetes bacterium]|nr:AAA family ATPase [Planctomycetota bacterium]